MESIRKQILRKLDEVEREEQVRIPIAVESGSRAWGFASPDSDYDCRFVYVRPLDWYLSVFDKRDTIDYRPDAVFDVGGWDLRKVIQHIVKSNAVMLEWLSSGVQYRMNERVCGELWGLAESFFDPVAVSWHYLSMARNKLAEIQGEESAKIKKYFYILRPLACVRFIAEHGRIPHMEYRHNLAEIPLGGAEREAVDALLREKEQAAEGHLIPPNPVLIDYFVRECLWAEKWLGSLRHDKCRDADLADRVFRTLVKLVNADG